MKRYFFTFVQNFVKKSQTKPKLWPFKGKSSNLQLNQQCISLYHYFKKSWKFILHTSINVWRPTWRTRSKMPIYEYLKFWLRNGQAITALIWSRRTNSQNLNALECQICGAMLEKYHQYSQNTRHRCRTHNSFEEYLNE